MLYRSHNQTYIHVYILFAEKTVPRYQPIFYVLLKCVIIPASYILSGFI